MISAIIKDKDMTPEHIETIIAVHNFSHVPRKEYRDAIDALRVDLYRMRQPITAEALTADGWRLDYEIASKGNFTGRKLFVFGDRLIGVSIWDDGDSCLYYKGNGDYIPMPSNMYDLRELVRLL